MAPRGQEPGVAHAGGAPNAAEARWSASGRSEIGARGWRALLGAGRKAPPAHLFELGPRLHLLREQGRLNPVEQAFQPAHQLRLSDPELALARHRLVAEGEHHAPELVAQIR